MQCNVLWCVILYCRNQTAAPAPSSSSSSTCSPTVFFTSFTAFCSPSMKNTRSPPVELYAFEPFTYFFCCFDNRQKRTSFVSKLSPTHQVWCCCSPTPPPSWLRHNFPSQPQKDWTLRFLSLVRFYHNESYDRWFITLGFKSSPEANMINKDDERGDSM